MIKLQGKYNEAKVFTDNIESLAISQIIELCNQEFAKDSNIAIMPDTHAGAGCTIGTTMTLHGKVVPNLVGVDIGCGMFCVQLKDKEIDLKALDEVIKKYIPSGQSIRSKDHNYNRYVNLNELLCKSQINLDRARKSIGTLGGGNHFIELNKDANGNLYLVVHSGSRYLGKQVAEYYQKLAIKTINDNKHEKAKIISQYKLEGREKELQVALKLLDGPKIPDSLCYLAGKNYDDYLHDMKIAQWYAQMNREAIADIIIEKMELKTGRSFHTIHNYIEVDCDVTSKTGCYPILRKGAISAADGEVVLIPINMRDGSIIAVGKGNPEWNYSAPHGAGRLYSRSQAKELLNIEEFKDTMKDIYSSSVCESTLDEAPMAYKPIEEILENIVDTVDDIEIIKPIYNYKAH
jgi:RNA-splicing ligase RtcB